MNEEELDELFVDLKKAIEIGELKSIRICGLMGMASFTEDLNKVKLEFKYLQMLFDKFAHQECLNCKLTILSMGMSSDYKVAIEEGSNMVRIGSLLFGERELKA